MTVHEQRDFERAATLSPRALIDPFARAITYLRVSVTDRCDFRCVYCMAEDMTFLPKADILFDTGPVMLTGTSMVASNTSPPSINGLWVLRRTYSFCVARLM